MQMKQILRLKVKERRLTLRNNSDTWRPHTGSQMRQDVSGSLYSYSGSLPDVYMLFSCLWLFNAMDGSSVLLEAASKGDLKTIRNLLKLDKEVGAQDSVGRSSLFWCAARSDVEGCSVLLDAGAQVNIKTTWGSTPLHAAAESGDPTCLKLLIERGADVNAQTKYGETPLHHACYFGKTKTVKVLLDAGASLTARNDKGRAPLDEARSQGHTDVIDILEHHSDSAERWRELGYTLVQKDWSQKQNLDTEDFEIPDEDIRFPDTERRDDHSGSKIPNESFDLTSFYMVPPSLPSVEVNTEPTRVRKKPRDFLANVFRLQQKRVSPPLENLKKDFVASCPRCGYQFTSGRRPELDSTKTDDVLQRLRNDYASLTRKFFDLQLDFVKEREENHRLKTIIKNHNWCCRREEISDLTC